MKNHRLNLEANCPHKILLSKLVQISKILLTIKHLSKLEDRWPSSRYLIRTLLTQIFLKFIRAKVPQIQLVHMEVIDLITVNLSKIYSR